MKLQQKIGFHNKFKLEVVRNGKVIQEGFAENIVLDRMYTKLCNLDTYWGNIVYGRGTGTLDATRTTLFNRISSASASIESTVFEDDNTISITRKATLGLTVSNGETITEVGISETTTSINTHALITDSEGNPISITKTDLDIIYIYSTVYIEFSLSNQVQLSSGLLTDSTYNESALELRSYLCQRLAPGTRISIRTCLGSGKSSNSLRNYPMGKGFYMPYESYSVPFVGDVTNKKTSFSFRVEVDELNSDDFGVSDVLFYNSPDSFSLRVPFVDTTTYTGHTFTDKQIGVGDGTKTIFPMHSDATDVSVKVDSVAETGVVYNNYQRKYTILDLCDISGLPAIQKRRLVALSFPFDLPLEDYDKGLSLMGAGYEVETFWYFDAMPVKANIPNLDGFSAYLDGGALGGAIRKILIEGSTDGGLTYSNMTDSSIGVALPPGSLPITQSGTLTHIKLWVSAERAIYVGGLDRMWIENTSAEVSAYLEFDTAPADGAIITSSYTVPYIPKDSDHVIDIDIELVWGEGTV